MGPYHRKMGQPNQDAYGSLHLPDRVVLVAADGAGSLDLSHVGASLAVEIVLEELATSSLTHGLDLMVELAMERAREVLLRHPDSDRIGCTLAIAAITETGYALGAAGDAFALARREDGSLHLLANPPAGEYANVTQLLTSKECTMATVAGAAATGAAVSTDGLEHASLKGEDAFPGFWDPVFSWAGGPEGLAVGAMLAHMDGQGRIDDDTTLVVAVPRSA